MIELLVHDDGVIVPELEKIYQQRRRARPARPRRRHASWRSRMIRSGWACSIAIRRSPATKTLRRVPERTSRERLTLLDAELDRYAV